MFNIFKKKNLVSNDRLDQFGAVVIVYRNIPALRNALVHTFSDLLDCDVWVHPYAHPIMKTKEVQKEVKWFTDKWFVGFDEKLEGIELKRATYYNLEDDKIREIQEDLLKVLFRIALVKIDIDIKEAAK